MSSTEISTSSTPDSPTTSQQPPPLTIFSRVASIPLVSASLTTIHTTLVNNHYTNVPYVTAQNLSKSVYHISEPIQVRLAPVLIRADGLANKSLDAFQSYYPTPFTITSEQLRKEVRERREHAYNTANKTLDDRVRTPAYSAAQAIDQVRSKFRSVRRFFPRLNFRFTHSRRNSHRSSISSKVLSRSCMRRMGTRISNHRRLRINSSISELTPCLAIFANSWHVTLLTNSNRSRSKASWCMSKSPILICHRADIIRW